MKKCYNLLYTACQVRQRERAKQEEERKSELIEAEKLAKTEIMSLISKT